MSNLGIFLIVITALALLILVCSIKVVRQSTAVVVERLGKYHRTLDTGVHFLAPFIDRKVGGMVISLKEKVADFAPQPVITKDNVTMQIDTVVYYQITDAKLFCYGVENPRSAIENLTATTLRNIVGELELDETLTSREVVNTKMRAILDEATDPWGIKINRVELKNILPPKDIRDTMEKQMRAERERREAILKAEGEKKSSILVAEGEKTSAVLRAEAEKESAILRAEAEKESAILRAEARRIELINEAEGQAEAIAKISAAKPEAGYLTIQGFEALKALGSSPSSKIIIPSELQDVTSLFASMKGVLETKKDKK